MSEQNKTPVAVLIADIHFTVPTLELASKSLMAAIEHANKLEVPLVVAGDTFDTKAVLRAECVNKALECLSLSETTVYMLVGNHDLINEKGSEHVLHCLGHSVWVIDEPTWIDHLDSYLIPYTSDLTQLDILLEAGGSRIIMHQGVQTAYMGHYQQDKSSLPKDTFSNHRVISGHYHRRQDIKCGRPRKGAVGLFSYIGNPYTLSFGEANDPEKGYQILNSDGTLTFVPLNLRKHVILERHVDELYAPVENVNPDDLIWLKVTGPYLQLEKLKKGEAGTKLFGHNNFKFDKLPTDSPKLDVKSDKLTGEQIFDSLIDNTDEKAEEKEALKSLWRELI